jgi:hypothetical protein
MKFTRYHILALPGFLLFTLLVYSPVHEFMHYAVSLAFGWEVIEARFIPHFWKGEFLKAAYVRWHAFPADMSRFWVCTAPYWIDAVVWMVGLQIPAHLYRKNLFIFWAFFLFFIWAPFFNTTHNLIAALFTETDFTQAASVVAPAIVYPLFGFLAILLTERFVAFIKANP